MVKNFTEVKQILPAGNELWHCKIVGVIKTFNYQLENHQVRRLELNAFFSFLFFINFHLTYLFKKNNNIVEQRLIFYQVFFI